MEGSQIVFLYDARWGSLQRIKGGGSTHQFISTTNKLRELMFSPDDSPLQKEHFEI